MKLFPKDTELFSHGSLNFKNVCMWQCVNFTANGRGSYFYCSGGHMSCNRSSTWAHYLCFTGLAWQKVRSTYQLQCLCSQCSDWLGKMCGTLQHMTCSCNFFSQAICCATKRFLQKSPKMLVCRPATRPLLLQLTLVSW